MTSVTSPSRPAASGPSPIPRWTGTLLGVLVAFALAVPAAAQQTGEVTGRVIAGSTGEPLIGAQVVVQGTSVGTVTNNRGRYRLEGVPVGQQTLQVQMLGYGEDTETVNVTAGEAATVEFTLYQQAIQMEGVVVTGTAGAARRREIGTTISQINMDQLETEPIVDVGDVLQGRSAGVTVLDNSGQVGAGNAIRLRGNNSLSGNNPLIYVDGVRIRGGSYQQDPETNQASSPLQDIAPQDIDRVEIIKGAAATTLYGTEASGGVIQIFTKSGAEGAPIWTLSVDQGVNSMGHVGPDVDPTGLFLNDCTAQEPVDVSCPESGSWFRDGHVQDYQMSVRGGVDKVTYFVSGNWGNAEGVIAPQGSKSWGGRGNFSFFPVEDLQIQFNSSYTKRDTRWIPDGNNAEGFLLNVMRGPRGYTPSNQDGLTLDMDLKTISNHFITGTGFRWTPRSNLTHRVNAGLDYATSDYLEEKPWGFFFDPLGSREEDYYSTSTMTLDYAGTLETGALLPELRSTLSWGGQVYNDFYQYLNGFGEEFAGPGDKVIDSGARTSAFETRVRTVSGGFFLQEMLGWKDRLFLTGGVRFDGFSTFGEGFGLAVYPKLSAAYMVSDHGFVPAWLETLKLRAAIGESGSAPGPFDALRTWESVSGDDAQPAVSPRSVGDAGLGPERTREYEAGFETSMFDGRLSGEFTSYYQNTFDALLGVQQVPSSGFGVYTQLQNVGEIENWGTETTLNVTALRSPSVTWDIGGRYSTNENKVVDLGGLEEIYLGWRQYAREGLPFPAFIHDVVQNPDEVGVEPIMEEEFIGASYPKWVAGLNTSLNLWRSVTFNALGEWQAGHVLSNGTGYQNTRRGVWVPCQATQEQFAANPKSDQFAGLTAGEVAQCINRYTTYGMWTMPADFFKLRSVALSYRLPEQWLGERARSATLSLQGRNLWTVTDYTGLDPETSESGSAGALFRQEYYNLPPFRSVVMNLRVTF